MKDTDNTAFCVLHYSIEFEKRVQVLLYIKGFIELLVVSLDLTHITPNLWQFLPPSRDQKYPSSFLPPSSFRITLNSITRCISFAPIFYNAHQLSTLQSASGLDVLYRKIAFSLEYQKITDFLI